VDSPKRTRAYPERYLTAEAFAQLHETFHIQQEVISTADAHDLWSELSRVTAPADRAIVSRLVEGFTMREIATELRVSHTTVVKRRARLRKIAMGIGVRPHGLDATPGTVGNGSHSRFPNCRPNDL
jgi:DNA-directed RNA polymerase specialized sigma24 family protein